jgi:hypothetical protein
MASRRKRGPVAFRPRLSAGLALSLVVLTNQSTPESEMSQVDIITWPDCLASWPRMSPLGHKLAAQIAAVGDLLSRAADIPVETASNAGWLVRSLAERIGDRLGSGS